MSDLETDPRTVTPLNRSHVAGRGVVVTVSHEDAEGLEPGMQVTIDGLNYHISAIDRSSSGTMTPGLVIQRVTEADSHQYKTIEPPWGSDEPTFAVWKFGPLAWASIGGVSYVSKDGEPLWMPRGAKVLHVGLDGSGELYVWARVVVDADKTERFIFAVPTGRTFTSRSLPIYHGSATLRTGHVFHVFESSPSGGSK